MPLHERLGGEGSIGLDDRVEGRGVVSSSSRRPSDTVMPLPQACRPGGMVVSAVCMRLPRPKHTTRRATSPPRVRSLILPSMPSAEPQIPHGPATPRFVFLLFTLTLARPPRRAFTSRPSVARHPTIDLPDLLPLPPFLSSQPSTPHQTPSSPPHHHSKWRTCRTSGTSAASTTSNARLRGPSRYGRSQASSCSRAAAAPGVGQQGVVREWEATSCPPFCSGTRPSPATSGSL